MRQEDGMQTEVYSITLAAGASRRLPDDMRPKTCCKVGAVSVIENALKTYEAAGVSHHVIVIGHAADQVMEEVTRIRRDVVFAYQNRPRGTGDAVECALAVLAGIGPPEHVLIAAGDKFIAQYVIRGLLETYSDYGCDLCLTAGRSGDFEYSGRIIEREGRVEGVIEVPDISVRLLAARLRSLRPEERPATAGELAEVTGEFFRRPARLAKCLPAMHELATLPAGAALAWEKVAAAVASVGEDFDLPGGPIGAAEALAAPFSNLSVYAARFEPLYEAVKQLGADNVQGERYLTDVPKIFAASGRTVKVFSIGHPEHVMAFNNLAELEALRRVHAQRPVAAATYPTLGEWDNALARHAGSDLLRTAAARLAETIGPERRAILVRSPGRINLMGRHVDHQGGTCNLMAIDREIAMAVSPREDDRINLWNTDTANYPQRSFSIGELTADVVWDNWLRTLDRQFIQRVVSLGAGDWANYIKGAALRLQHRFRDRTLRGVDAFVAGDIPVGAGLSSSSALLVAATEALIEINGLNVRLSDFVDLCGEGEWFVDRSGGSADHAVIKYGTEREVLSVSFLPFRIRGHHPFPEDCSLIVCHSGLGGGKSEEARERLSARVACYHLAREVIRGEFPQFAERIRHLRDVSMEHLAISLPALYRLLARVPRAMSAAAVGAMAEKHATVAACLAGVRVEANAFPLRDMAVYGLAECARAVRAGALLDCGDIASLGEMMMVSHDGDRVAAWRGGQRPYDSSVSDEQMGSLIERADAMESLDVSGAALWRQPGAYDCSTPEIDRMVDAVAGTPGVLGAQISGAGLGGCIMVLARNDAVGAVEEALTRGYYAPREIAPRIFACRPARGSHVLTTLEGER